MSLEDIPKDLVSREEYYMGIALAVRAKANCRGSRVGSLIVKDNRIISTGYNGTPSGMTNCLDGGCHRCRDREKYPKGQAYDLCICVHAEQNSILAAARFGISVEGADLYTTMQPCFGCIKEMLQVRIQRVFYLQAWTPMEDGREEYARLQERFPGGLKQLIMDDPWYGRPETKP